MPMGEPTSAEVAVMLDRAAIDAALDHVARRICANASAGLGQENRRHARV